MTAARSCDAAERRALVMGSSHAASGALAWAAVAAVAPHLPLVHAHMSLPTLGVGVFACAGAALLPDLDHPEGTAAWTFGPASKAACRSINRIFHGHRHGTHTILFALGAATTTWLVDRAPHGNLVILFVLLALAIRALRLIPHVVVPTAAIATFVIGMSGVGLGWLPLAVGLGSLVHIAGDALTVEGVPALYPLRPMKQHVRLPILGHAGSRRELLVAAPLMTVATAALLWVGR